MMILITSLISVGVFYFVINIIVEILASKSKDRYERELEQRYTEPFSVSDYYNRTQQQQESLQTEKENQEPYVIILWCGNDGLRLNDDDSFEWIKKNKEEVRYEYYTDYVQDIFGNSHPIQRRRPVSVSYQPKQTINKEIYELEEKIRNYPKNAQTLPDEYWKMIALLSNLYKIQSLQSDLHKLRTHQLISSIAATSDAVIFRR